jgi:GDP-L-fucose synthase
LNANKGKGLNKADKIVVTGAAGLVGSAVVDHLRAEGYENVIPLARADCDLLDTPATFAFLERSRPDHVFHAAARVYGLGGSMKHQGSSFYENVMINTNVVEASRRAGARKITVMGAGAVYPFPSPGLPLKEDMIFLGRPHPAHAGYANAKRAMLAMLEAYEESYGLKWAYIVSGNLFGPRDRFDVEFGNVVPSLVKKFYDAKKCGGTVQVWGDGSAERDFIYVKDAARAAHAVMSGVDGAVNMGSGGVYRIRDVVEALSELAGTSGRIEWDHSKPNGEAYRGYDLSKLKALGFKPAYSLRAGLEETWNWYCEHND